MIPLKLNGKKYNVPTIDELSVSKFIEITSRESFNIVDYLSVALGVSDKESRYLSIKNPEFISLQLYGRIPDYSLQKPKRKITIGETTYKLKSDFTLGQRVIIEENAKGLSNSELPIFVLAVACDQENYDSLLPMINNMPASEIFPDAFFLLRSLLNGSSFAVSFLRRTLRLIEMLRFRNLRELTN